MIETSFVKWMLLREQEEGSNIPPGFDPFTTLLQKAGDMAYFGVHDLSKFYKKNRILPSLELGQIEMKSGQIVNADPVNQTITVATKRAPYHYGYHKLEDEKAKSNRKTDAEGNILVTLPTDHLQNVTHMFGNGDQQTVWLVIDGNTKYQKNLMKEIRRQEIQKAAAQNPQGDQPSDEFGAGQDGGFGGGFDFKGGDDGNFDPMADVGGNSGVGDFGPMGDDSPMGDMPPLDGDDGQAGGDDEFNFDPNQGLDPTQGQPQGMPPMPQGGQQPQGMPQGAGPSPIKAQFKLKNREIVPSGPPMGGEELQVAHYNPSITSNEWHWKRNHDSKHYPYFPA